jgi:glycosidase
MISLRRSSKALRRGSLEWLRNSDEARIVTYLRRTPEEEVLVAINLSNRPFFGSVEFPVGKSFSDVTPEVGAPLPPDAPAPDANARLRTVGLPALALDSWAYRIFRR